MKQIISRDTPLAEVCLRKYEKPYNLNKRELIRKLCLSLGLLQPGDSRDVVVDVLYVMLQQNKEISSEHVREKVVEFREAEKLPMLGIASSNIRRQLKRLREIYLIEKVKNNYRVTENATLTEIFNEKLETFLLPSILGRMKEYLEEVDKEFKLRAEKE